MMQLIDKLLSKLGLVRASVINEQLDFARNINKRLDEHREVVESIASHTDFFARLPWHLTHMSTQDDYLVRLFHLRYGKWPAEINSVLSRVRRRPTILEKCQLPEYFERDTNINGASQQGMSNGQATVSGQDSFH